MRLPKQVALVTGGGSGIGLAVVDRFIAEGASVGVFVNKPEHADLLRDRHGSRVAVTVGDVRNPQDNCKAVDATVGAFGRLDTFVGNAGIWDFMSGLAQIDIERLPAIFDEILGVNVLGYLLGARACIADLKKSRGSMIFTASTSSFLTGGGGPVYVASKHAVVGVVKQLAHELAPDIRVNAVAPGGTLTPLSGGAAAGQDSTRLSDMPGLDAFLAGITPLGFTARPEQHTDLYVTLAAKSESAYVTGSIWMSDGGISVGMKPPASSS